MFFFFQGQSHIQFFYFHSWMNWQSQFPGWHFVLEFLPIQYDIPFHFSCFAMFLTLSFRYIILKLRLLLIIHILYGRARSDILSFSPYSKQYVYSSRFLLLWKVVPLTMTILLKYENGYELTPHSIVNCSLWHYKRFPISY